MEEQRVYVELDTLLDTRLGAVAHLNDEAALDLMRSPEYYEREHDDLGEFTDKITTEEFRRVYAERDTEVLWKSRPTEMLVGLMGMVRHLVRASETTPFVESVAVDLNVWPYTITEQDQQELDVVLEYYLGTAIETKIIRQKPDTLRPAFIKETYAAMIMYDLSDWIEKLATKLQSETSLARISFISPALYKNAVDRPGEELYKLEDGREVNAFAATEIMFSPYMNICYQPSRTFTLINIEKMRSRKRKAEHNEPTGE